MAESTTRERIRAEIEGYAAFDGIRSINAEMLAARIDRALFELPEAEERALEQWAADEVASRERTRTALSELEAEVRTLLRYITPHDWDPLIDWGTHRREAAAYPRIAALVPHPIPNPD